MARVLVVDDDPVLNQMVQANMRLAGHEVFSALSGQAALRDLESINPELVILDVMMPGMTGFEVCRRMRETTTVPVLFLTARGEEEDLVQGFDSGGDDYMRKPFSQRELEVRVRALLQRAQRANEQHETQIYIDDQLQIDLEESTVKRNNKVVHLTPTEFRVLRCLVRNRGKVLTHAELLVEAWGENYTDAIASLSLYVRYLREKIEKDPSNPEYIHTKWGIGYWFSPPQTVDVG
ncbi:MAG TPA: response regulator transcription factor [Bellilinea sp.]